mmetsp:Transcript_18814/g.47853  ORF Transcript_18814/g.47853 Transcript_18814/m.47853 type:complete len:135 (-) Transcript_18814:264-668(-)
MLVQADEYERAQDVDLEDFFVRTTNDKFHTTEVRGWVEDLRRDRDRRRAETSTLGKRNRSTSAAEQEQKAQELDGEPRNVAKRSEPMKRTRGESALPCIQPGIFSYGIARQVVSPTTGRLEAVSVVDTTTSPNE